MFQELDKTLRRLSYKSEIHPEDRLIEDLGFDSLKLMELIVKTEEIYSIEITDTDLDPGKFKTVKDIYQLAKKYIQEENQYQ